MSDIESSRRSLRTIRNLKPLSYPILSMLIAVRSPDLLSIANPVQKKKREKNGRTMQSGTIDREKAVVADIVSNVRVQENRRRSTWSNEQNHRGR
ncbi:hypothetical protein CHS0354_036382 [Potamilus streckersoni]|uniref:Uncharacterized protein n=1 Tax=Potamilus streckersoni TaxID=2493646 RepID=A0AAE0SWF6_9BIVA|nr:hypothetical protein CHS0354_036382 [Potamilus streckersoni]